MATSLAGVSSYLVVRNEPPVYRSRVTLMVGRAIDDPNPSGNELYLSQQLAQSYADIASREPMRNATMDALEMTWLPGYYARAVPNTQLLEIYVTDYEPERAQAVAAELAKQLVLRSPGGQLDGDNSEDDFITEQIAQLESQILETESEIESQQRRLGELFSASEIKNTQEEIQALEVKLRSIRSNYALLLNSSRETFSNALNLIEPASLPRNPLSSSKSQSILVAAAVSLALAVGAAYVLEFLDDSIRSPEMLARVTPLPVLGVVSRFRGTESANEMLWSLKRPRWPEVEAYRALRTGILLSSIDAEPRRILITSATPGDGKSVTAANLAVVLAQADKKVLLIDADLRRPSQHEVFDVANNKGLTDLFLALRTSKSDARGEFDETIAIEKEQLSEYLKNLKIVTEQKGLDLLTTGAIPPNPSELLGSKMTKVLIDGLLQLYDVVIFDTPPILAVTDAVALSAASDWVMCVVRAGKTKRTNVKQMLEMLGSVGANMGGIIFNAYRPLPGSEYYSSYGYATGKGYSATASTNPSKSRLSNVMDRILIAARGVLEKLSEVVNRRLSRTDVHH